MDTSNDIVEVLDNYRRTDLSITILALFKIPFMIIIIGNFLFVVLLFFKIKILTDTFDSSNNKLIKSVLRAYIGLSAIASLFAFFLILLA